MASNNDITLLGFDALDIRTVKVGDIVRFRSTSIIHGHDLAPRHAQTAKVTGFSKNRNGAQQVEVKFRTSAALGDDTSTDVTKAFPLAVRNLVDANASREQANVALKAIGAIVSHCTEQKRPWMVTPKLRVVLGDHGMYDTLGTPAANVNSSAELEALPY